MGAIRIAWKDVVDAKIMRGRVDFEVRNVFNQSRILLRVSSLESASDFARVGVLVGPISFRTIRNQAFASAWLSTNLRAQGTSAHWLAGRRISV